MTLAWYVVANAAVAQTPGAPPALPVPPLPGAAPPTAAPSSTLPPLSAVVSQPAAPTVPPRVTSTSGEKGVDALTLPKIADPLPLPKAEVAKETEDMIADRQYSFGDSPLSILFLPEQITRMKNAIRRYEDANKNSAVRIQEVVPTTSATPAPPIKEPSGYPVFYLSSIVYHSPVNWAIWMNGYPITSHKNTTDIEVISINKEYATFQWKPIFMDAIVKRKDSDLFASIDSIKNKLAAAQPLTIDSDALTVKFTLRQNQSYAPAYNRIFEGYVDSAELPTLPQTLSGAMPTAGMPGAMPPPVGISAPPVTAGGGPGASLDSSLKARTQAIQNFSASEFPNSVGAPPSGAPPMPGSPPTQIPPPPFATPVPQPPSPAK